MKNKITQRTIVWLALSLVSISFYAQSNTVIITKTTTETQVETRPIVNGKVASDDDVHSYLDDLGIKTKYKVNSDGELVNKEKEDITKPKKDPTENPVAEGKLLDDRTTITTFKRYENGIYRSTVTIENQTDHQDQTISVDEDYQTEKRTMKYWVDEAGNRHDISEEDQVIILTSIKH